MKQGQLHYVNQALYAGCGHGLARQGRALAAQDAPGHYLAPMFDAGEAHAGFGRLVLEGDFSGARLEVVAAASNSRRATIDDREVDLKDYFASPEISPEAKREALLALPHLHRADTADLLLHPLKGRYLWVMVSLYPQRQPAALAGVHLTAPWQPFSQYLPELYQGNDFFDRFLSVFQSMFLDLEARVDDLPTLLDYETTPPENLEFLASWLGIDNSRGLFSPEQLRRLIAQNDLFQGQKGTRAALEALVELVCGVRPRIVEHFQWMRPGLSPEQQAICRQLYGESPDHFCLVLDMTEKDGLPVSEADLHWLIETNTAFGTRFKVVYLRRCHHTDTHCYLDVNSALSEPAVASVDGGNLGGHITVG